MTTTAKGYAALSPTSKLQPFTFERRAPIGRASCRERVSRLV